MDHCSTAVAAFSATSRRPKKKISARTTRATMSDIRPGHLLRCWLWEVALVGRWPLSFAMACFGRAYGKRRRPAAEFAVGVQWPVGLPPSLLVLDFFSPFLFFLSHPLSLTVDHFWEREGLIAVEGKRGIYFVITRIGYPKDNPTCEWPTE